MTKTVKKVIEWLKEGHDDCTAGDHHYECGCPECKCTCGREAVNVLVDEYEELQTELEAARGAIEAARAQMIDRYTHTECNGCGFIPGKCRCPAYSFWNALREYDETVKK